jgi:hypothetical protein
MTLFFDDSNVQLFIPSNPKDIELEKQSISTLSTLETRDYLIQGE